MCRASNEFGFAIRVWDLRWNLGFVIRMWVAISANMGSVYWISGMGFVIRIGVNQTTARARRECDGFWVLTDSKQADDAILGWRVLTKLATRADEASRERRWRMTRRGT
ncbi:hypothetical protein PS2_026539 [Malus domestica]